MAITRKQYYEMYADHPHPVTLPPAPYAGRRGSDGSISGSKRANQGTRALHRALGAQSTSKPSAAARRQADYRERQQNR